MNKTLSPRQQEILKFVEGFIARMGYSPTRRDIAECFGFASQNAAEQHLQALSRKGAIRLIPGISRGIALNQKGKK